MIIRKAMYGCGLYFFIQLAYNSPILCKFAERNDLETLSTFCHEKKKQPQETLCQAHSTR